MPLNASQIAQVTLSISCVFCFFTQTTVLLYSLFKFISTFLLSFANKLAMNQNQSWGEHFTFVNICLNKS